MDGGLHVLAEQRVGERPRSGLGARGGPWCLLDHDGSVSGDWRLPNINELSSIATLGAANPAVAEDNPLGLDGRAIWSSTSFSGNPTRAWAWFPGDGHSEPIQKADAYNRTLILVRDGRDDELAALRPDGAPETIDEIGELLLAGVERLPAVMTTAQTSCWDVAGVSVECSGSGQDGERQRGFAQPGSRFASNGDGTVVDRWTQRVWLEDTRCLGTATYDEGQIIAAELADPACDLADGSDAGDWALPTPMELRQLTSFERSAPVIAEGELLDAPKGRHWTATPGHPAHGTTAWAFNTRDGVVVTDPPNLEGNLEAIRRAEGPAEVACALVEQLSATSAVVECNGLGHRVRMRLDLQGAQ